MDMLTYADTVLKELNQDKSVDEQSKKQLQVIMYNVIDTELDEMTGSIERGEN